MTDDAVGLQLAVEVVFASRKIDIGERYSALMNLLVT
jgi:hypothetical protein